MIITTTAKDGTFFLLNYAIASAFASVRDFKKVLMEISAENGIEVVIDNNEYTFTFTLTEHQYTLLQLKYSEFGSDRYDAFKLLIPIFRKLAPDVIAKEITKCNLFKNTNE